MPTLAEQEVEDAMVRHQVYLLRQSTGITTRVLRLLNDVDRDLADQIANRLRGINDRGFDLGPATTERLQKMQVKVRELVVESERVLHTGVREELYDLAAYESGFTQRAVQSVIPLEVALIAPEARLLRSAVTSKPFQGRLLREWTRDWSRAKYGRVTSAVRIGIAEGESVDQIVRRVRGTRALNFRDGVLDISRRGAQAMIRTATRHVTDQAQRMVYDENKDVIKAERWVSTLDGRTTAICRARDGKQYPVGEGPRPPAHINCRSVRVPITKDLAELLGEDYDEEKPLNEQRPYIRDKRALKDIPKDQRNRLIGQVPADTNYAEWLRRQPVEFQNDVLGVKKGRLFRQGGLKMDKFVDLRTGREFTIDELRQKEPAAWRRAFG